MPKANGKHYSYDRQFNGQTYSSDGRTFSKQAARQAATRKRWSGRKARVVRLGKSNRYAVYARRLSKWRR